MLVRNLFAAGITGLLGVIVLITADFQMQQLEKLVLHEQIGSFGGTAGKLAVLLVFASILYYQVRETFITARARKVQLPAWLEKRAIPFIGWLRLMHPLAGLLTVSLVLLHGYIMWWIWAAGNFGYMVISGMVAGALLVLLLLSGVSIRLMPKRVSLRLTHRLQFYAFLLALIVHRLLAG